MNVLALSGSLRSASINSAFCRALARLAPPPVRVTVYAGMAALPLFNPDLDAAPPAPVLDLRAAVAAADVLLIASPEYAHGISGVMKNALDWLVACETAAYKPVALVNTSPRASHAYAALAEVLRTMSAQIIPDASLTVPLLGNCVTEEAMHVSGPVRDLAAAIFAAMERYLAGSPQAGCVDAAAEARLGPASPGLEKG